MIENLIARAWRGYADVRRRVQHSGSASAAYPAHQGARRANVSTWTAALSTQHGNYRDANPPLAGQVAIVCVSSRPCLLDDVIANVERQTHADREFVLVTNSLSYEEIDVEGAVNRLSDVIGKVTVLRRPPEKTLGSCLNDAIAATDARFVAKFDDDDRYGANYLSDSLRAHSFAGAGVVGKHTYYAHLVAGDRTVIRFPAHEFSYTPTLAGGTLVIDRQRTRDLVFPDISLGEDRAFIASCHRRGISTFSADRFCFVQTRSDNNTWKISDDEFVRKTLGVAHGLPLNEIEI